MATDLIQVLRILRIRGVCVKLEGGRLIAGPPEMITNELRQFIRSFRTELIAHLQAERERKEAA